MCSVFAKLIVGDVLVTECPIELLTDLKQFTPSNSIRLAQMMRLAQMAWVESVF